VTVTALVAAGLKPSGQPDPGRSRVLGCDLSYDYVRINGEYTT
jgi:hypothetical protein